MLGFGAWCLWACATPDPNFPMSDILCGVPLPEDCTQRHKSFKQLLSSVPSKVETDIDSRSEEARTAARQMDLGLWMQASPRLERVALGAYGDTQEVRQQAELSYAYTLYWAGDHGGGFDLLQLILSHRRPHVGAPDALSMLPGWAASHCRTRPAMGTRDRRSSRSARPASWH